jgi:hypothetical protein
MDWWGVWGSIVNQCCGSGAFLTPELGMDKKIKIRIRYEHRGSYFQELRNNFLGFKKLKFFDSF